MADDIKIRVGVQNNVKAGMDGVVRDVRGGLDRSMRGKGFAEAFGKMVRGDISGALEDLQERMGKGMNGIAAKAVVWGGGIATALFAGFKAGKQLDEAFGLSDKIGGAIGNMLTKQVGPTAEQTATKEANRARWAEEDAQKKAFEDYKKGVIDQTEVEIMQREEAIDALQKQKEAVDEVAAAVRDEANAWGDVAKLQDDAAQARARADNRGVDRQMMADERAARRGIARRSSRTAIAEAGFERIGGVGIEKMGDAQALKALENMKSLPRWQRLILEAGVKERAAGFAAANEDARRKQADDAQVESRDLLKQIKTAQELLAKTQADLLKMK